MLLVARLAVCLLPSCESTMLPPSIRPQPPTLKPKYSHRYVLVSVGITSFMALILGRPSTINDATAMQQQMQAGMGGGPGQQMDTPKLYQVNI